MYLWVAEFLEKGAHTLSSIPLSPELDTLRCQLPGVLVDARASSTTKLYMQAYKKWKDWTFKHSKLALPADPQVVVLYLLHLAKSANSFSVLKVAISGLAWAHKLAGFSSPSQHVLVAETLAGLKVRLAKPKQPKVPFSVAHIHLLFDRLDVSNLTDVRNVCLMGLAFFAFLRFDEVVHLKVGNVSLHNTHAELIIEKAKNDQLRQGNVVVIAKLPKHCPVAVLQLYLQQSKAFLQPQNFLFRRVVVCKGVKVLDSKYEPLKYTNVKDMVKAKAASLGLNPASFGTHSLRSGGCSTAANAGIGDRLFQRHGRWASVAAKDGYVSDSLQKRLTVTEAMQ
jgi:integrase